MCVAVSQLLEEVKVVLLVSVYSQQGEELEQLVLHLAQLRHWLSLSVSLALLVSCPRVGD